MGKNPPPCSREDKQARAVGAWEMRGSAGHIEGSDQESVQECGSVCDRKRRLRGREYCTSELFCVVLLVDFILKETRSHAGSPSFSSLHTLWLPIWDHVFSSTVAPYLCCCFASSLREEEEWSPTSDNSMFSFFPLCASHLSYLP